MVNKKGFEMQFHWIFVLIAGAIILIFFFSLIQKQKSLSEERLAITLSTDIEAIFTGAIQAKGTAQLLRIPQPGIAFSCSEACECNFWIGRKATEFKEKIIFSPDLLQDSTGFAWALDWKMPFRATNFLFLTGPGIKYYFVLGGPQSARFYEQIKKLLPEEIEITVLDSPSEVSLISEKGHQETKLIFLDSEPADSGLGLSQSFKNAKVSAVKIRPNSHSITFYSKKPKSLFFESRFVLFSDIPEVYAAMFAADIDMYECGMKKAFKRLGYVSEIMRERAKELQTKMTNAGRQDCIYVAQGLDYLQDIQDTANTISTDINDRAAFDLIDMAKSGLDIHNKNLILNNCPAIY